LNGIFQDLSGTGTFEQSGFGDNKMKILYVAELVGKAGIYVLKKALPELKRQEQIDFTVICADGATGGNGLGRNHAGYIRKLGADAITTGDYCFYKKDLVENWVPTVVRPVNLGRMGNGQKQGHLSLEQVPGFGWRVFKVGGTGSPNQPRSVVKVAVAVFLGANFTRIRADNPFRELKPFLEKLQAETPYVVVDFHAWATGEKRIFFTVAAGLCTAVIGSHSRVQTADEAILDGTAVICDAGRTGSTESVGGTDSAVRIQEYLTEIPDWTKDAWEKCELQGVIVEADGQGRALCIKRLRIPVPAGNQKMPEPDISEEG
jgi:metallophosphoesterase (TIGR00282 family)